MSAFIKSFLVSFWTHLYHYLQPTAVGEINSLSERKNVNTVTEHYCARLLYLWKHFSVLYLSEYCLREFSETQKHEMILKCFWNLFFCTYFQQNAENICFFQVQQLQKHSSGFCSENSSDYNLQNLTCHKISTDARKDKRPSLAGNLTAHAWVFLFKNFISLDET